MTLNKMKTKDIFVSTIKGIITGIATLIPSISPAAIILSISAYDNLIEGISNIGNKNNKKLSYVAIPLIIGMIIGLIVGSHLVNYFFTNFKTQTILLFVGLILGGIRVIKEKKKLSYNKKDLFTSTIILLLSIILIIIFKDKTLTLKNNEIINILLTPFIIGLSLIIPGLSLFTIHIEKGYTNLLNIFKSINSIHNILLIIISIAVLTITVILITKIINKLIKKYQKTYQILCNLMLISIIVLISQIGKINLNFVTIFTSILSLLWGYIFAKNVERE